ncbi:TPR Domain containing protein [Strigomonas culicis]|nr:TPR Domain containing protein [Strigomonas culicis]|eukprot:EPY18623.1 TPR Domain containing protein [Strigomonas culicis]
MFEYLLNRGVCAFKLGMDTEAQGFFTNALIQCGSKNPKLLFFRGGTQLLLKLLSQAHWDLEEAIDLAPIPLYIYTKGLVFFAENNLEEAKNCFHRALSADPDAWEYSMHMGIVHHLLGEPFAAVTFYHRALRLKPTQLDLLDLTGLAYAQVGFYPVAVHLFSSCVSLKPHIGVYHFRKAVSQILSKNPYGARESLRELKCLEFSRDGLNHLHSVTLRLLGNYPSSLEYANKAVEEDSMQYTYLFNRAEVLFAMGAYQKCIEDCQRAVQLSEFAEAFFLEGRAHHALGASHESLSSFASAKRLSARLATTPAYNYSVSVVLSVQKRWKEALESIELALRACPTPLISYVHERAKLKQFTGNPRGAVDDFNYVLERQPENFNALLRRAFALRDLRRYDEAALDLAKATSVDPSGVLAEFGKEFFFETECFELCPPGNEDDEEREAISTF